jgi:uncharacterized membrane protein
MLSNGTYKTIDYPGAGTTQIYGINDSGEVVGNFVYSTGGPTHGFRRLNGVFKRLDYPGAAMTFANGVNATGQIVGNYCTSSSCSGSFKYVNGVWTSVRIPGAVSTTAHGINKNGDIVGTYCTSSSICHGFVLHSNGTYKKVDYPGAVGHTSATGIDDNGDVVGNFQVAVGSGAGYMLHNGTYTKFKYPNYQFTQPQGINNQLYGAGYAFNDTGPDRSFYVKLP